MYICMYHGRQGISNDKINSAIILKTAKSLQ